MMKKIELTALKSAANDLKMHELDDISELSQILNDDAVLRKVHHLLFEVHLIDGFLICPETSRKFPVKDGIPNMLLHEDEV